MIDPASQDSVATLMTKLLVDSSREELLQLLDALGPVKAAQWLSLVDLTNVIDHLDPAVMQAVVSRISTPEQLRQFIDLAGDSDELIEKFGIMAGITEVLNRVFELAGSRLVPERISGENGTIEWYIHTPGGTMTYHLTIADGEAQGGRGPAPGQVAVTVAIGYTDMLRLAAGLLDGIAAFMADKIEVSGDMIFGARLSTAFNTTAGAM